MRSVSRVKLSMQRQTFLIEVLSSEVTLSLRMAFNFTVDKIDESFSTL